MMRAARVRSRTARVSRAAIAGALAVGLLASCASNETPATSGSGPAPAGTATPGSSPGTTTSPAWAEIDRALAEVGPAASLLVAQVADDGTCQPIHEVAATTPRPVGSQFKLFVLGALAEQVAAGDVTWDQALTIVDADKSIGNGEGSLQAAPPGSTVTVEEAATKMISISDNTAADMLIALVGRDAVEAQARAWMADASGVIPFLTTKQMFLLHYVPGLAEQYLATPADERADFLATEVDPRPITDIGAGLTAEPSHIDTIEWFASAHDVCQAFAGLHQLADDPALAPLTAILSQEDADVGLDASDWPTVWYKGGSEPGVLALGWLATTSDGETFVVELTVADRDAALADDAITRLRDLGTKAFAQVG